MTLLCDLKYPLSYVVSITLYRILDSFAFIFLSIHTPVPLSLNHIDVIINLYTEEAAPFSVLHEYISCYWPFALKGIIVSTCQVFTHMCTRTQTHTHTYVHAYLHTHTQAYWDFFPKERRFVHKSLGDVRAAHTFHT